MKKKSTTAHKIRECRRWHHDEKLPQIDAHVRPSSARRWWFLIRNISTAEEEKRSRRDNSIYDSIRFDKNSFRLFVQFDGSVLARVEWYRRENSWELLGEHRWNSDVIISTEFKTNLTSKNHAIIDTRRREAHGGEKDENWIWIKMFFLFRHMLCCCSWCCLNDVTSNSISSNSHDVIIYCCVLLCAAECL